MKYLVLSCLVCAAPVSAESLCDLNDLDELRATLAGEWAAMGRTSVEATTLSVVQETTGFAVIDADGRIASQDVAAHAPMPLVFIDGSSPTLEVAQEPYDVDHVDDLLETVEAEWIADELSLTPCGPEELLQMSVPIVPTEDITVQVTLLPYFEDQFLLLSEGEVKGAWGIAFITKAALFTRVGTAQ